MGFGRSWNVGDLPMGFGILGCLGISRFRVEGLN